MASVLRQDADDQKKHSVRPTIFATMGYDTMMDVVDSFGEIPDEVELIA
jgi:hypothetical protein